jgi:hypothetical protein
MSNEYSRIGESVGVPTDRTDEDDVDTGASTAVELSAEESAWLDASIDSFKVAVEQSLAEQLDDEEVLTRLEQVRRRVNRWSEETSGYSSVAELAGSGYPMVQLWLRLAVATDQSRVGLAEDDIDEIAQETVAQAVNRASDEPFSPDQDIKAAFLAECVDRLPFAYQSWRLKHETLSDEQLQSVRSRAFGDALVDVLRRCVISHEAERLLASWGHTEDHEATIAVTRRALGCPCQAGDDMSSDGSALERHRYRGPDGTDHDILAKIRARADRLDQGLFGIGVEILPTSSSV